MGARSIMKPRVAVGVVGGLAAAIAVAGLPGLPLAPAAALPAASVSASTQTAEPTQPPVPTSSRSLSSPVHTNNLVPATVPTLTPTVMDVSHVVDSVFTGLGQLDQQGNAAAGTLFGFLTDGLCGTGNQLACDLSLLSFTVHSVYDKPGGGQFVGNSVAVLQVPTPVDITGDAKPDIIVTVGLTSLNTLSIRIQKTLFAPATLPASVELVAKDPTNTKTSSKVAVGYDQRTSSIPSLFVASASLKSFSPVDFLVSVKQTGANAGLNLTGSLFELASNGTRKVLMGARVSYVPAPPLMTYDILADQTRQHVTYTASVATTLTADVDLVDGSGEQTIHAVVSKLPNEIDFDRSAVDDTHQTVQYHANDPITSITLLYRNITHASSGDVLNTEITGSVGHLPVGLTFKQDGAGVMSFATTGGPIGVVAGGIAHLGHVDPVPTSESGAKMSLTNGDIDTAAARVLGLSSVTVNAPEGGPYYADTQAASQPLHAVVADTTLVPLLQGGFAPSTRWIDAHVNNLPAHLTLRIDVANKKIVEDGHGQAISEITADVWSTLLALFGRVFHIHGELHNIPAGFILTFSNGAGAASATLTAPDGSPTSIGEIDLEMDDGNTQATVPAGEAGVIFRDQPSVYALALRVFGLSSFAFSTDNTTAAAPLTLTVNSAGAQVFLADVAMVLNPGTSTQATITLGASVDALPATLTMTLTHERSTTTFDNSGMHVSYKASTPIAKIDVNVTEDPPFVTLQPDQNNPKEMNQPDLSADHVHVIITGLPAAFELDARDDPVTGMLATMQPAATSIEFYLDDGTLAHTLALPHQTKNGSLADDRYLMEGDGDHNSALAFYKVFGTDAHAYFAVSGRVFGLNKIQMQPPGADPASQPMVMQVGTQGGVVFDASATVDQTIDDSNALLTAKAEIAKLPASVTVTLASDTGPDSNGTSLKYSATSTIGRIEAYLDGPTFMGGMSKPNVYPPVSINTAHFVYAKILDLPPQVSVDMTPGKRTCMGPSVDLGYRDLCYYTKPSFAVDTTGGAIRQIELQVLPDINSPLALFSTWSNYGPGATSWQADSSATADGVIYRDLVHSDLTPDQFALALQLSGLRSASMSGSGSEYGYCLDGTENCQRVEQWVGNQDQMNATLSVDKSLAQPFNVDVQTQNIIEVPTLDPSNPFVVSPSAVTALEGFVNKPQPNMKISMDTDKNVVADPSPLGGTKTLLDFSANGCLGAPVPCSDVGVAIQRIFLREFELSAPDGNPPVVPGDRLRADILNVPNQLRLCMGTSDTVTDWGSIHQAGSTDVSGCLKNDPRPQGYPPDTITYPHGTGEYDANHNLVLDINDYGTTGTDDANALTVNLYACVKTLTGGTYLGKPVTYTCDPNAFPATTTSSTYRTNGPGAYAQITDLKIHNLMLDAFLEGDSGGTISGHLGLDTGGQHVSGSVEYHDQTVDVGPNGATSLLVSAGLSFPQNFSAEYRYTDWAQSYIPPAGKYQREWGYVPCFSDHPIAPTTAMPYIGAEVHVKTGPVSEIPINVDIAPRFLCHVDDGSPYGP